MPDETTSKEHRQMNSVEAEGVEENRRRGRRMKTFSFDGLFDVIHSTSFP